MNVRPGVLCDVSGLCVTVVYAYPQKIISGYDVKQENGQACFACVDCVQHDKAAPWAYVHALPSKREFPLHTCAVSRRRLSNAVGYPIGIDAESCARVIRAGQIYRNTI